MTAQTEEAVKQFVERFPMHSDPVDPGEAMRYALVNGNLPATIENLKAVGFEFYLDADKLPERTRKLILELAEKLRAEEGDDEAWQYVENVEDWTDKELKVEVDGVHIENGEITDINLHITRKATITDRYGALAKIPLEEVL
jgi:hypothetical protein